METIEINREHEAGILGAIENNPIYSFNDIFVFYKKCCRATAYNHNLDKLDTIKEAIYEKKRKGVTTMLSKWIKSDNPTLQISAMKIICDPEEHKKLQQNYTDVTSNSETITQPIQVSVINTEQLPNSEDDVNLQ